VTVAEMAGVVNAYLRGPGGLLERLSHREREEALHTHIHVVANAPLSLLVMERATGPDDHLLGLFTNPNPTIQLFCADIAAVGYDPVWVLDHELGHRFGFDHDLHTARAAMVATPSGVLCTGIHDLRGAPLGVEALKAVEQDPAGINPCPVCRLYDTTVHAHGLLQDLTERAMLAAMPTELHLGLGGTIPLARGDIATAQLAVHEVAAMLPDRLGELRDFSRQLAAVQKALKGWLTPAQVGAAVPLARAARSTAYTINQAYWIRHNHPVVEARDLDTIAAFR
jgi:hypothetical protein